ncbi:hypothetical protein FB645_004582 [Coemansia sp. IMI 203386]|nr:hypothetical protein FB645_004582 [Coemansia sp. IMI 203386]
MTSSGRVLVARDEAKGSKHNPIIYPKSLLGKMRRFKFLIGMNTGFYVLDPWERKVTKYISVVCLGFFLLMVVPKVLAFSAALYNFLI